MQTPQSNSFDKACREAFALACETFLQKDIQACCDNAGAHLLRNTEKQSSIRMSCFNRTVTINIPGFFFSTAGTGDIGMREKILILHYLCTADGFPLQERQVNFKQLRSAAPYFPLFEKRCIQPLVSLYLQDTGMLTERLQMLGGTSESFGDFSVRLNAFPRVPVVFLAWHGDDEFPARGDILFDAGIEHYLSGEDIVVMCQQIVTKTARRL